MVIIEASCDSMVYLLEFKSVSGKPCEYVC